MAVGERPGTAGHREVEHKLPYRIQGEEGRSLPQRCRGAVPAEGKDGWNETEDPDRRSDSGSSPPRQTYQDGLITTRCATRDGSTTTPVTAPRKGSPRRCRPRSRRPLDPPLGNNTPTWWQTAASSGGSRLTTVRGYRFRGRVKWGSSKGSTSRWTSPCPSPRAAC